MAGFGMIRAIDEAYARFKEMKDEASNYKYLSGKACLINFDDPIDRDLYQDDATEFAGEPYRSENRPRDVERVLRRLGFTDRNKCSPCFELSLRQYFLSKKSATNWTVDVIPNFSAIADDIKEARKLGLLKMIRDLPLPSNDITIALNALSDSNVTRMYGVFYSCCLKKLCDPSKVWHCRICRKCHSWRWWHCKTCNKCQYGLSVPCKKCQPDLYLARMEHCGEESASPSRCESRHE